MKTGGTVEGYRMVTFAKSVPVYDDRGQEMPTDRAVVGMSAGARGGHVVVGIVLAGSWFIVTTRGKTAGGADVEREYRVPVTNVTSAQAIPDAPEAT